MIASEHITTQTESAILCYFGWLHSCESGPIQNYKQLSGTSDLDAKSKYVHLCRGLKTYGVTFFLVKEKLVGKNKLVPRLLGVNKECVMRVDEKTKDVLKEWPLEQVRRWNTSPRTFTLFAATIRFHVVTVNIRRVYS
ncbi:hypothetical protein OSTOST_06925 [Ostertagia ostertagi]